MTRSLLTLALTLVCTLSPARADNWPQWRGPKLDGISAEKNIPAQWNAEQNVLWKFDMPGMGGATPVVWEDRLFVTSESENDIVLMCINTAGRRLWEHRLGSAIRKARGDEGNGASASPCTDGKHVWAFAGSGELTCLTLEGKEVWTANLQERYGRFDIQFGMHSTPVLEGDRLYLQLIHSAGAWVIALEKATGKEVWKVKRESDGTDENEHSYASPTLWRKADKAYLITHGNDYAIAHKLEDGKEIWRVTELNPRARYNRFLRFVASPVATPDVIIVPSAKNGPVVAVKPGATGIISAGSKGELWRRKDNTPDVPCPLVVDGLVYLCRENGVLICMDAKTGTEYYQERLFNDRYRASPVYADGKIYLTARSGVVTVVRAGTKPEVLSVNRMNDSISASPVIANGRIYLRGFNALYAIGAEKN